MSRFNCENGNIEGLKIITPFFCEDERGYFLKNFEKDVFKEFGLTVDIFEDFESLSKHNVIRGLHFQTKNPQAKLVRVIRGEIMDVAVDLRVDSRTFGAWQSIVLSEHNLKMFWIPEGFAHGFLVRSKDALVSYKCVGKYLKEYDSGIRYDDKDIGINWEIDSPIVSSKDESLMSFQKFKENYNGLL